MITDSSDIPGKEPGDGDRKELLVISFSLQFGVFKIMIISEKKH